MCKTLCKGWIDLFGHALQRRISLARWVGQAAIAVAIAISPLVSAPVWAQQVSAPVWAQKVTSNPLTGHEIALIDVAHVLKNLPEIKAHIGEKERDSKRASDELLRRRAALKQSVERLKELTPGTADYARQEEQVAKLDLEQRSGRIYRHRSPSDAEAKIYRDSYQRIVEAVKTIAKRERIMLVLRVDREEMNLDENDSVTRGLVKDVVHQENTVDITDAVLRQLNQETNRLSAESKNTTGSPQ